MEDKETSYSTEDYQPKHSNPLDESIDYSFVSPIKVCRNPDEYKTTEWDAYRPLKTSISPESPENPQYGYTRPLIAAYKPNQSKPLERTLTEYDKTFSRRKSAAQQDISRRMSCAQPDNSRRKSSAGPDFGHKKSSAQLDISQRKSATPLDINRRKSADQPNINRRKSSAQPNINRMKSAIQPDFCHRKSSTQPDIVSNYEPRQAGSDWDDGASKPGRTKKSRREMKFEKSQEKQMSGSGGDDGASKSGRTKKSRREMKFEKSQEKQMWKIIRVLFLYLVFLFVQMSITYRIITPQSFLMKQNLENVFMKDKATTDMMFKSIRNTEEFWMWARSGFLNGLFVIRDYNSVPASSLRGYINDGVSYIMGYATLRQQRIRPGLCDTYHVLRSYIEECNGLYSNSMKDRRTYAPGWISLPDNQTDDNDVNVTKTPYMYRPAATLDGYTYWGWRHAYGGGGYVLELNGNRSVLEHQFAGLETEGWIDKYTRAVFIEFTVYNPNVNFFCVATILIEYEPTGGTVPSYRFEPAVLLMYRDHTMIFQMICEFVFFAFTVSFIVVQVRKIFKQRIRYLQPWHYLELVTILCAVTSIVVYFYKFIETKKLTLQMNKSRGSKYMKFQYVGYWNEFFSYSFGWVVFFGILKFIRLLRFNKRIFMLAGTWRYGAKSIAHFSFIFWVLFLAFAQLFYLTFMSSMYSFHHMIASVESCFTMLLGLFDIYQMTMVSPMLAKLYIFMFTLTIMFVIINMFMSILNETFANVRLEIENKKNKYEIIDFMVGRFKQWGGSGRRTLRRTPTRLNNQIRKFRTSRKISLTPNKMGRLLNSIYRSRSRERRMNKNKEQQIPHLNFEIEDLTETNKTVDNVEMKSNPDKVVDEPREEPQTNVLTVTLHGKSDSNELKTTELTVTLHGKSDSNELKTTELTVILHGKPDSNRLAHKNIMGHQPSYKDFVVDEKNIP